VLTQHSHRHLIPVKENDALLQEIDNTDDGDDGDEMSTPGRRIDSIDQFLARQSLAEDIKFADAPE